MMNRKEILEVLNRKQEQLQLKVNKKEKELQEIESRIEKLGTVSKQSDALAIADSKPDPSLILEIESLRRKNSDLDSTVAAERETRKEEQKRFNDSIKNLEEKLEVVRHETLIDNVQKISSKIDESHNIDEGRVLQDVKDIKNYDASKATNKQLGDDWRLCVGYYSSVIDPTREIKFSAKEIIDTGVKIAKEIFKRKVVGEMSYSISIDGESTDVYKQFWDRIKKEITSEEEKILKGSRGIYLVEPHGDLIYDGEKTAILKSVKFEVPDDVYLISNRSCYGLMELEEPTEISLAKFKNLRLQHCVTEDERMKWWPNSKTLFFYKIKKFYRFKKPRKVRVPDGVQTFIKKVVFLDSDELDVDFIEFVWLPKFLSVTGKAVYGSSPHDLDIVVKCEEKDGSFWVELDKGLRLKIDRIMKEEFGDLPTDWIPEKTGPNWKSWPIYDLVLRPRKVKIEQVDEPEFAAKFYDERGRKLTPFEFFKTLKPLTGRRKAEEYTIDSVVDVVKSRSPDWFKIGIYIQKKFDGVNSEIHSDGAGRVVIFSEEGNDISNKLPKLVEQLKAIKTSFIACGELEHWEGGKHSPRQKTNAIIHSKEVGKDQENIILNVHDILFWNGHDIHNEPYSERIKFIKSIDVENTIPVDFRLVYNEDELRDAIAYFAGLEGSEGSYLKLADFKYELDGSTLNNIKYKNTLSIDVKVKEIHAVKGADAWNYLTVLENGTPAGRTYNTSVKADIGDIIEVEFVNLNKYIDPKTQRVWFNFWSPRVVEKREKKTADNIETAERLVKASKGTVSMKDWPTRYVADADPFMFLPDENKRWKGMVHAHCRGRSVHLDVRLQISATELLGWTVFLDRGLSRDPISFSDAKSIVDSEILPIVKETLADPMKKFSCKTKLPEPIEWIDYDGEIEEGGVGATKFEKGFFYIIDEFEVQFGAAKEYFHEYFLDGKLFNEKIVVRKIENKKEWKKTPEGLMTWMMFKTKELDPYAITKRAVDKKWVPPENHSALPRSFRAEIPAEYKYWSKKSESERMKIRDNLVEAMKKKDVKIVIDAKSSHEYKLQKQTWRGPHVIRYGPSRVEYHLLLSEPKEIRDFISDDAPPTAGVVKEATLERWNAEGVIKARTKLNPTKNTPSRIEVITGGRFRYVDKEKTTIIFVDGELGGVWSLIKPKDSTIWTLKQSKKLGGEA